MSADFGTLVLDALASDPTNLDRLRALLGPAPTTPTPTACEWLTVAEVAEHLRARPKRVYDLVSQRRIAFTKDGSRVLIARSAVHAYLAENARETAV